jgi:hypothetical protein
MALDPEEQLARLPRLDVTAEAVARIRRAAMASLRRESETAPSVGSRLERFWTRFIELPSTALVVLVYLVWAVNAASGPLPEMHPLAMGRPTSSASGQVVTSDSAAAAKQAIPEGPYSFDGQACGITAVAGG